MGYLSPLITLQFSYGESSVLNSSIPSDLFSFPLQQMSVSLKALIDFDCSFIVGPYDCPNLLALLVLVLIPLQTKGDDYF